MTTMNVEDARFQIQQLANRYALCCDSRDIGGLASLFFPADRSDPGPYRREIGRWYADYLKAIGPSFMLVGSHVIEELTEDSGKGQVYTKSEYAVEDGTWMERAVLYRDTYIRVDGSWYFGQRDHAIWYVAPRGGAPIELGEVPSSWPTWQAFLDGADDPGLVDGESASDDGTWEPPGTPSGDLT